ncbi:MAG: hypothetical protein EBR79_03240 [Proteobacteria bacterium]|nr:hypothetical protein [Pseudomonadota bacterium]
MGGFEPLAIAAELLGETAHLLTNRHDLSSAAQTLGPRHLLLIDTPGLNPYQPSHLQQLAQHIAALQLPPEKIATHLVVPTTLNEPDMAALPVACHRFSLASMVFTKLDATNRYGALTGTAANANLPVGLATHTPDMASAPIPLTAKWLAEALNHLPRQPWELTP